MEILNEEQNQKAIKEIEELMNVENPTQEQDHRIEELSCAVERFEDEHYPIPDASREEVLKFLMEQNSIPEKQFEVLSNLDAVTLGKKFNISPELFEDD
jgi:HTH-type transcriptional regulator/antitoxin HigA